MENELKDEARNNSYFKVEECPGFERNSPEKYEITKISKASLPYTTPEYRLLSMKPARVFPSNHII